MATDDSTTTTTTKGNNDMTTQPAPATMPGHLATWLANVSTQWGYLIRHTHAPVNGYVSRGYAVALLNRAKLYRGDTYECLLMLSAARRQRVACGVVAGCARLPL